MKYSNKILFVGSCVVLMVSVAIYSLVDISNEHLFNYIFSKGWLLCLIISLLYPLFQAWREALYFSLKAANPKFDDVNEHPFFAIERGLVYILMGFILQSWSAVYLALLFPFLHDGFYYYLRNNTDGVYPKRWLDQPKKSTALLDKIFKYPLVRTVVFIGSLIAYLWTV